MAVRVLHIVGTMDPGGVETWLLHVLGSINRERYQFHFCTLGAEAGLYARRIEELGGEILRCPADVNVWELRRRFDQILRTGRYDIVHSHVSLFSGTILRWAKAAGVPMRIAHSHTNQDDKASTPSRVIYRRLMKRWIKRYATHGLAISQPSAAYLFGENWQRDPRFQVLHYGINLQAFREAVSREEVRRELGIPVDVRVVGHVGNFVRVKNHAFLLEIAAEVLKRRPEVHFVFIGDGPLRPRIEEQARAANILNNVHLIGRRTDVARLLRGALDIFVFPSIYEGFGLSLLEAQAAGLKCLVSSTVPDEVAMLPGLVEFLSLSAGAEMWAAKLLRMLETGGAQESTIFDTGAQSSFSIQESALKLADVYVGFRPFSAAVHAEQYV